MTRRRYVGSIFRIYGEGRTSILSWILGLAENNVFKSLTRARVSLIQHEFTMKFSTILLIRKQNSVRRRVKLSMLGCVSNFDRMLRVFYCEDVAFSCNWFEDRWQAIIFEIVPKLWKNGIKLISLINSTTNGVLALLGNSWDKQRLSCQIFNKQVVLYNMSGWERVKFLFYLILRFVILIMIKS